MILLIEITINISAQQASQKDKTIPKCETCSWRELEGNKMGENVTFCLAFKIQSFWKCEAFCLKAFKLLLDTSFERIAVFF